MNRMNRNGLVAVLGIALSGGLAMAAEPAASTEVSKPLADVPRELARQATENAAEAAIRAVTASNRLDLDIRLIGPTSKKIAGDPQVAR